MNKEKFSESFFNKPKNLIIIFLSFPLLIFVYRCNKCYYGNGVRCASVYVYNNETGIESDYDLPVEIKGGKVDKILWPSGGWLDESHIKKGDTNIDCDGYVSFEDDRGRSFGIFIKDDNFMCKK